LAIDEPRKTFSGKLLTTGSLPESRFRDGGEDTANQRYNFAVARGWESKSIEAQQAEAGDKSAKRGVKMTAEQAAHQRIRDGVLLSRKRVLQQMDASRDERHRLMLQKALDELDQKLREL
jgi:hypothetical protein